MNSEAHLAQEFQVRDCVPESKERRQNEKTEESMTELRRTGPYRTAAGE